MQQLLAATKALIVIRNMSGEQSCAHDEASLRELLRKIQTIAKNALK